MDPSDPKYPASAQFLRDAEERYFKEALFHFKVKTIYGAIRLANLRVDDLRPVILACALMEWVEKYQPWANPAPAPEWVERITTWTPFTMTLDGEPVTIKG